MGVRGAVDGDCPHNYITAFQQPFEQHARGSDTPHPSFISRLGSRICHDRYGPHGNSGPKFRAPRDGRALHLSAYKCVDLKQRVGHCKDKGSNAEGRDNLKTHLVSEKSCLRAVICRVSCELLAGTFMFCFFKLLLLAYTSCTKCTTDVVEQKDFFFFNQNTCKEPK